MLVIQKFLHMGDLFLLFTFVAIFSMFLVRVFGGRRDSGKNQ